MRLILLMLAPLFGAAETTIDSGMFSGLEARALGPATMSGRIAAIDGSAADPRILYVVAAGGGVWKTSNGGLTFKPVFDKYAQSIGAIAVDRLHPDTVWVGTGESWVRNSTSVGTGIYKSTMPVTTGNSWNCPSRSASRKS